MRDSRRSADLRPAGDGTPAALQPNMQPLDPAQLAMVVGGESFGDIIRAVPATDHVPVAQTYQATIDFIRDHPFFHQGLMNAPIGGGKHFRNVPFVGPGRVVKGVVTGNSTEIQRGIQTTRGTWDAP
ncbi:MAG TPA: hypothetical protein VGG74_32015 [Kofleriaceae bacterium]